MSHGQTIMKASAAAFESIKKGLPNGPDMTGEELFRMAYETALNDFAEFAVDKGMLIDESVEEILHDIKDVYS